jgi:hypothetical protein
MRCLRHGEDFTPPLSCKACETDPATAPESDYDHEAPFIEGLPTAIEHEKWFVEISAQALQWAEEAEKDTGRAAMLAQSIRARVRACELAKNREGDDLIRRNVQALKDLRSGGWPMGVTIGAPKDERQPAGADEGDGN